MVTVEEKESNKIDDHLRTINVCTECSVMINNGFTYNYYESLYSISFQFIQSAQLFR